MANTILFVIMGLVGLSVVLGMVGMAVRVARAVKQSGGIQGIAASMNQMIVEHPSYKYTVRTQTPRAGPMWIAALIILGFAGISTVVTGFIQWNVIRQARLLADEGVSIQATVTDRRISEDDDGDETYYVWYEFETIQNDQRQTVKRKESVSETLYRQAEPGGVLDVIYAPSDPQTARLMARYTPGKVSYVAGLVGGGIVVCQLGVAFVVWRQHERAVRLDTEGAVVMVPLLDKFVSSDSDSTTYYVAYQIPGSEPVRHSISKQAYERLSVGQQVQVRYLDLDPHNFRLES